MSSEATHGTEEMLVSFISTLPDDVLLHLFHVGTFETDVESLDKFPVLASHVCHHWRDLALTRSTLWTTVIVANVAADFALSADGTLNEIISKAAFPQAGAFLDRSLAHPVHVDLRIRRNMFWKHPRHAEAIVQLVACLLAPHIARVKGLSLLSDSFFQVASVVDALFHLHMPLLEECTIGPRGKSFDTRTQRHQLQNLFQLPLRSAVTDDTKSSHETITYPNLRRLRLCQINLNWPRFTLANLQSLAITHLPHALRPSTASLRDILLANDHSLQALDLSGALPLDFGEPYTLSNVHSLALGYHATIEASRFVQSVTFPKLESLSLIDLYMTTPVAVFERDRSLRVLSLFQEILNHVPVDKLLHLSLDHVTFYPPDPHFPEVVERFLAGEVDVPVPLAFISKLSALQTLCLFSPDRPFLRCLNFPFPWRLKCGKSDPVSSPEAGRLLPSLREINFRNIDYSELRLFVVRRCSLAKCTAVPPLERLRIEVPHRWEESINQLVDDSVIRLVVNEFRGIDDRQKAFATTYDSDVDGYNSDFSSDIWVEPTSDDDLDQVNEGGNNEGEKSDDDF